MGSLMNRSLNGVNRSLAHGTVCFQIFYTVCSVLAQMLMVSNFCQQVDNFLEYLLRLMS